MENTLDFSDILKRRLEEEKTYIERSTNMKPADLVSDIFDRWSLLKDSIRPEDESVFFEVYGGPLAAFFLPRFDAMAAKEEKALEEEVNEKHGGSKAYLALLKRFELCEPRQTIIEMSRPGGAQ